MDDNLNDILSEEGAPLTTYQAIIRVLVKMWQAARDEVRSAAHTADRLRPVAVAAAILAAMSLAGCLYLGTVVHRQQGEINAIHRILEEGVVVEETTTMEETTTAITQDTGDGNGNNVYQAGENSSYTQNGGES